MKLKNSELDDSYLNCQHAQQRGWTTAHLVEHTEMEPDTKAAKYQIRDLEELREIFPQFFKSLNTSNAKSSSARCSQM